MDLDGAVDDVVEHLRAADLDEGDLDAGVVAGVERAGGVEGEQPGAWMSAADSAT